MKRAKPSAAKEGSRRPRKTEELALHLNCVQWFRKAYPHVLAFHVPNGEKRDRRTAEKLKRMGVLPGVHDWLMFPSSCGPLAVEFKAVSGTRSTEQINFSERWFDVGGRTATVQNVESFKEICAEYCGPPAFPWV